MHGFQKGSYIVLKGGSLDDAGDGAGTDQKNGNADDLAEAVFHIFHTVSDLSGGCHADKAAYRQSDQGVNGNTGDGAEGQHDDDHYRAQDCCSEGRKLLFPCGFHVSFRDLVFSGNAQTGSQNNGDCQGKKSGNKVAHHDSGQILGECLRYRNRVGVGGNNVACLAAADHGDQNAALGKACSLADRQRNRRNSNNRDVDEYAYCADDHRRDRDRGYSPFLAQFFNDRLRDLFRRSCLDQGSCQNAAGQDPQDR